MIIVDSRSRRLASKFCRQTSVNRVTRDLPRPRNKGAAWYAILMTLDMVDSVWSAMQKGEFYSPSDLANTLGQPSCAVVRVLEFLTRYGFAERVTRRELIFRKFENDLSPGNALMVLRMLVRDAYASNAERIANFSKAPRRFAHSSKKASLDRG